MILDFPNCNEIKFNTVNITKHYHKTLFILAAYYKLASNTVTLRHWELTGHVNDTFREVADISESLSTDSFSLTKALV